MKTFLEVEGKMGPIPGLVNSDPHYQIPTPTLGRTTLQRKEREQHLRDSGQQLPSLPPACLPIPEAPPKPKTDVPDSQSPPSVPVCKSTPWPGTGKMSGNLFEDRNWLLPPNYLDNANENKTENEHKIMTNVTSPRPPLKEEEEPKINEQSTEKCGLGTRLPLL